MKSSTIYLTIGVAAAAWLWWRKTHPSLPPIAQVNQGRPSVAPEHKSLPPTGGQKFAGPNSGGVAGAGRPTDTSTRISSKERPDRWSRPNPGKSKVTHRG